MSALSTDRAATTATVEPAAVAAAPDPSATSRGRARQLLASGWPPALLLVVAVAALLRFYGVSLPTTAVFGGYVVGCVVLPGLLVWRAAHGGTGWFGVDVAAGTAVGYAGEVGVYILGRWLGLPLLVLAWPLGVVAVFLAAPRLRRYFRGGGRGHDRAPAAWSWSMAAVVAAVVFWSVKFFRWYGLRWPGYANVDTDSPLHLALVGEAKHHMPMEIPWLAGEPLYYHWFVYADMAATSWVTGIEPQVLLLRLAVLPMLAAFAVLVAGLAMRLAGAWWPGVAAVVITFFVLAPNPYGWSLPPFHTTYGFGPVDDGSVLRLTVWTGPTQTFGALLFVPIVLLVVDLLRRTRPGAGGWVLLGFQSAAVVGAKATYLPLLLAALAVVVLGRLVATRRLHRPALAIAAMTLVIGITMHFLLFGPATQGLYFAPLRNLNIAAVTASEILGGPEWWAPFTVVGLTIWCWTCVWVGISGVVRRGRALEPATLLLLGIGIGGAAVTLLFVQNGDSQRLFLEAARPYLSVAAVVGLAAVLAPRRDRRAVVPMMLCALVTGVVAVVAVRAGVGDVMPSRLDVVDIRRVAVDLMWPYALLFLCVVVVGGALLVARRSVASLRGVSHALVIALMAGFGLASAGPLYARVVADSRAEGWRDVAVRSKPVDSLMPGPLVTEGTLEAGRWLRRHSHPDDLVATNAHCLPARFTTCVNLHFAVTAYTERRVLVEGWGFTDTAHRIARERGTWVGFVPYWAAGTLAANDAVFTAPTPENAAVLRDRHHVRWLFVDETGPVSDALGSVASFRFRSGRCAVYELMDPEQR